MIKIKKNDFILSIVLILFGFIVLFFSFQMTEIASLFPKIISISIIVLSIVLLIKSIVKDYEDKEEIDFHFKIILKAILGIAIYIIMLDKIGYVISTFLLVGFMLYILNFDNKKLLVLIPVITSVILFVVFKILLKIPLPMINI